ncbi:hypothetical protein PUN28_011195 [Cardiocondyla obscurior]|uniref:Uncharacterized protein n=1 Tax=Cardiocondyla obscurior TaxID=286306 RepID=A0AAW2FPZ7_9HYME
MNKQAPTSPYEMAQYRERLLSQKQFLTDILSKIDKQILALQVERLHLRNTLLGSEYPEEEILPNTSTKVNNSHVKIELDDPNELKKLDLSVTNLNNYDEETEDEL